MPADRGVAPRSCPPRGPGTLRSSVGRHLPALDGHAELLGRFVPGKARCARAAWRLSPQAQPRQCVGIDAVARQAEQQAAAARHGQLRHAPRPKAA